MLLPIVLMAVSGCVTEDWVRNLVEKKDIETNQRLDRLGEQLKTTDQLARGANERADAAMNRAESVDGRLTCLWSNRYRQRVVDTVEIYFDFNKADLSEGAQVALLDVVKELQASPTLIVRLRGFSDLTGTRDSTTVLPSAGSKPSGDSSRRRGWNSPAYRRSGWAHPMTAAPQKPKGGASPSR